eukprot:1430339-Pleurochrysis_carterae.AAC.2
MAAFSVSAVLDGSGDGWVHVMLDSAGSGSTAEWLRGDERYHPVGLSFDLLGCLPSPGKPSDGAWLPEEGCEPLPVFGGTGGLAEASGWFISAGHAFASGVYAFCLSEDCRLQGGYPPMSA